ncbi:hypothetical protein BDR04DRAFT_990401, partial [Suillus decipiens]
VFAAGIAAALAQTIELGYPQNGDNLYPGQELVVQVIRPISMAETIQVGIALGISPCVNGSCPDPAYELYSVLYAGPWTPDIYTPGIDGPYQNFTVTIPSDLAKGPAIFTLTHLCIIGVVWAPLLEFRNATVNI